MFKKIKYFIDNRFLDKRDLKLIILAIILLILFFFGNSNVFAGTEAEVISITKLEEIIKENGYVLSDSLENFTYTNVTYSNFNKYLGLTTYKKFLTHYSLDGTTSSTKLMLLMSPSVSFRYSSSANSNYGTEANQYYIDNYFYEIDIAAKTITYQNTKWVNLDLFKYSNNTDMTVEEFKSVANQKNMFWKIFFYDSGTFLGIDSTTILNEKISFEVNETISGDETFSGYVTYSTAFEKWLTDDLSASFLSGDYSYYLEQYMYNENGFDLSSVGNIKISDVAFESNSIYLPSNDEVESAIKSFNDYEEYGYTITLNSRDNEETFLLSSDLIIINVKPVDIIPNFRLAYDYIYYPLASSESGDFGSSGDVVVTPSGDSTDVGGGITGIWQAIVNLPKTILDGLVGLFVPGSNFFFNEELNENGEPIGYFNQLNYWFSERLGFLYYPFDFMIDFFNRYLDVDSFKPVFEWDDIYIPFFDSEPIIKAGSFDLKADFIEQEERIANIYETYLILMDGTIVVLLIALLLKKYEEVTRN